MCMSLLLGRNALLSLETDWANLKGNQQYIYMSHFSFEHHDKRVNDSVDQCDSNRLACVLVERSVPPVRGAAGAVALQL